MERICDLNITSIWFPNGLESINDSILIFDLNDTLWKINVNNCEVNAIGKIGLEYKYIYDEIRTIIDSVNVPIADGDLVYFKNKVYIISFGRLFEITLDSELNFVNSRIVNDWDIEVPTSFGLTYLNNEDPNNPNFEIFSITSLDINYKINPDTGNYDTLYTGSEFLTINGATYLINTPTVDTSDTDTTHTNIKNHSSESEFRIYPNPIKNGIFYIEYSQKKHPDWNIEIYDILGKKVNKKIEEIDGKIQISIAPQFKMCIIFRN